MTRVVTRSLACAALLYVHGCVTVPETLLGPPLEARWYFQPLLPTLTLTTPDTSPAPVPADAKSRPQVEIVLVNRSPRVIEVSKVFLNAHDRERDTNDALTWILAKTFVLPPGGYTILPTNLFERKIESASPGPWFSKRCLLPVSLAVKVSDETRTWLQRVYSRFVGDDADRVRVDMSDRLPTAIPEQWRECIEEKAAG